MKSWIPVTDHGVLPELSVENGNKHSNGRSSNNSAALMALLESSPPGSSFYFPLGVYLFEGTVEVPGGSNFTLFGLHCWDVVLSLLDAAEGFTDPDALTPFFHTLPSGGDGPWIRGLNIRSGEHFGVVPQPPPVPVGFANPNPGSLALLWEASGGGVQDLFFHPPTFPDNPREYNTKNTELSLVVRGPSGRGVFSDVWSCNSYSMGGARVEKGGKATFYQLSSEHHLGHELHLLDRYTSANVTVMQTEDRDDSAPTSSVRVEGGASVDVTALFSYYAASIPSPAAIYVDSTSTAFVKVFRQWHSYHPMFYNCSILGVGGESPCLALNDFVEAKVASVTPNR